MTSALRPEPRPCAATRACSCVVSEPWISDCSSDSASAGETPSAAASCRALSRTSRSRRKSRVGWPAARLTSAICRPSDWRSATSCSSSRSMTSRRARSSARGFMRVSAGWDPTLLPVGHHAPQGIAPARLGHNRGLDVAPEILDDAAFLDAALDPAGRPAAARRGLVSRRTGAEGAAEPRLHGAGLGHPGRHPVGARRPLQEGRRAAGVRRVLHQLRQPQGQRARRESARRGRAALGHAQPPGAARGPGRALPGRRERRVLRLARDRQPDRRLGEPAEPAARLAHDPAEARRRRDGAARYGADASAALGRLSLLARGGRTLVRGGLPRARPRALDSRAWTATDGTGFAAGAVAGDTRLYP